MNSNYGLLAIVFVIYNCTDRTINDAKASDNLIDSIESNIRYHDHKSDIDSLPIDSIKIGLGDQVDTLYGYKRGDTITIEEDIIMNIPPEGMRGAATSVGLWPKRNGKVEIRYAINAGYNFPDAVRAALNEWSQKTGILFTERKVQNLVGNYIEFMPSEYTESYVGCKREGRQIINLGRNATKGNMMHEVGHSLGLYHEQSRSDRDRYIQVLCTDDLNYRHAFSKDPYEKDTFPYNYYSIMHYPIDKCLKVLTKDLPMGIPGQRDSITTTDYNTIKAIYGLK